MNVTTEPIEHLTAIETQINLDHEHDLDWQVRLTGILYLAASARYVHFGDGWVRIEFYLGDALASPADARKREQVLSECVHYATGSLRTAEQVHDYCWAVMTGIADVEGYVASRA